MTACVPTYLGVHNDKLPAQWYVQTAGRDPVQAGQRGTQRTTMMSNYL